MNDQEASQDEQVQARALRIEWADFDKVTAPLANVLVSQMLPDSFVVTFGQVIPTYEPGMTPEEFEQLNSIRANIVGRITLTPPKMEEFIGVLQANYARWQGKYGTAPEEGESQ